MQPTAPFRVHLGKESLKFSSAHMTVFSDGSKEALHGHNYRVYVTLDLESSRLEELVSFARYKDAIRKICGEWDEKVLLQRDCPRLKIVRQTLRDIEFRLCGKRYVLPVDEVILLPVDNITSEALAKEFTRQFVGLLKIRKLLGQLRQIEVRIDETPGQGASYRWLPSVTD